MQITWIRLACDADYNTRVGNGVSRTLWTLEDAIRHYASQQK